MAKSLGIFVSSSQHLDKILKLCKAAKKKNIDVTLFLSHVGILLTQDTRFSELEGLAKMALCKVGFENYGLKSPVRGIAENDYSTQAKNGELIEDSDRYLVF